MRMTLFTVRAVGLLAVPGLHAAERPNLVLILVDDLGYANIGPFGSKLNRTPNLDRIAKEAMKLTGFYACPVCLLKDFDLLIVPGMACSTASR